MLKIRKQYVVNENNEPVAVQIDIETFRRLERLLEDYALGKLIEAVESEKPLCYSEAKQVYERMKKRR